MITYFKNENSKKSTLKNIKEVIIANTNILQMRNIIKDFVEEVYKK
jgi:hypothetical protein